MPYKYFKAFNSLVDLIMPHRCYACHDFITQKESLCTKCWLELEICENNYCDICSVFLPYSQESKICETCTKKHPIYTKIISNCFYNAVSSKLIQDFKYKNEAHIARLLSKMMTTSIQNKLNLDKIDLICPVPLHPKRLKERTFNQSQMLANLICKSLNLNAKLTPDLIHRIKNTPPQVSLKGLERESNLKDAFALNTQHKIRGLNILLIDDVVTTTATISNCCEVLLAGGAVNVFVLCFARSTF